MPSILSRAKSVLVDVPRHGKLAYCLLRDERVPVAPKAMLLGALGIIAPPAAVIPFFQVGKGESYNCAPQVDNAARFIARAEPQQ